jgi:FtsP/CotA-like multicopper oxidase with cupredoxin domain
MLVAGETAPSFPVQQSEVVRLYLTNTANTRVFNVALPGARMKLVGGDSGRVEGEEFVESILIAPSERAVVDVLFVKPGPTVLEHRTPDRTYTLATIEVAAEPAAPPLVDEFAVLRVNPEWTAERRGLEAYADVSPDKTLAFVAEMDMGAPEGDVIYMCPMHPEVVGEASDRCPKCGMKLVAVAAPVTYVCPMHPEVVSEQPDRCPKCGMKLVDASLVTKSSHEHEHHDHAHEHQDTAHVEHEYAEHQHDAGAAHEKSPPSEHDHAHHRDHGRDAGGIEWEDDMLELNRRTTPANMRWMLVDRDTGAANHGIAWQFTVGDRVKMRLVNEMDSDHPMHHPFHVHGAGRFVVLARNGVPEPNYVWKDTVLVRTGETVDILLDVTNPGRWMAHCHIAEHHESGMMFSFDVAPAASSA